MTLCFLPWTLYTYQYGVCSLKKEFAPRGANSILQEPTRIGKDGKNENSKVASLKSVPIHLTGQEMLFFSFWLKIELLETGNMTVAFGSNNI